MEDNNKVATAVKVSVHNRKTGESFTFYSVRKDERYFSHNIKTLSPYLVTKEEESGKFVRVHIDDGTTIDPVYGNNKIMNDYYRVDCNAAPKEIDGWFAQLDGDITYKVTRVLRPKIDKEESLRVMTELGGLKPFETEIYFHGEPRYADGSTHRIDDTTLVHFACRNPRSLPEIMIEKMVKDKFGNKLTNVSVIDEGKTVYVYISAKTIKSLRDAYAFLGVNPKLVKVKWAEGGKGEVYEYKTCVEFGSIACR